MLDLAFAILMVVIIVKANKGEVSDMLCNIALVVGILAGFLGLVQAFFLKGNHFWILNIVVMLFAFALKRIAQQFAKLHDQKMEEFREEYRKSLERHSRNSGRNGFSEKDYDFDDPNIRFGGGSGETWNGK